MTNNELLTTLQDIENTKQIVEYSKIVLHAFANDESVPLDKRWEIWSSCPTYMKNSESIYIQVKGIDDDFIHEYCQDRYRDFDVAAMILSFEEDVEAGYVEADKFDFNKAKQDILSRNLGSFTYDW